ncbi:MAG: hypothetical protein V1910_00820 [bacterium]
MEIPKQPDSSLDENNRRAVVGLPETATEEEVKAAYAKLSEKNRRVVNSILNG